EGRSPGEPRFGREADSGEGGVVPFPSEERATGEGDTGVGERGTRGHQGGFAGASASLNSGYYSPNPS
ncbi:MAG TPA: hypothetical protein VGS41_03845, partial [Chthonomonadales bacterium]|nr:hypothetical protein [Chthonomonadales bacterium]